MLRSVCVLTVLAGSWCPIAWAAGKDLGNGFIDHGVATPVSNDRGIVATVDGDGRDVVLAWLFDHRGGYALLAIDAQTGKTVEYPMPFPPGGDCPYASILSSGNKFYTHFNSYFCEFDPTQRAFTFHKETAPRMAMGMTEDDNGIIWSVTYPQSGVVSFNPKTREFKDYGHVHKENWAQYQRHVVADDAGWIYFGIGSTASHVVAFDPATVQTKDMIPEGERRSGAAGEVYRDLNGKVYGTPGGDGGWYEFHKGEAKKLDKKPDLKPKPIITSSQSLFHREFASGRRIVECNLVERILRVEDTKTQKSAALSFDYASEGAHVMGVAVAPDGTLCGGTAFPMRFFSYDPRADKWVNRASYGQWNTITRLGDRFFVGGYTGGFLLEWDPSKPWVPTVKEDPAGNPRYLAESSPDINRPHGLLAHPNGDLVILAGTPGYGLTGGGLMLWERRTRKADTLKHTELIPQQAAMSLLALPEGKLLVGTTTEPGTGGEKKAQLAELYILDLSTKKIEWHEPLLAGVQTYADLCSAPDGLVYGIADYERLFVFDPTQRKIVHEARAPEDFGRTCSQQGPRIFIDGPRGEIFVLFRSAIARVEPGTFKLEAVARSPVPIQAGGDYHEGRIYFASSSHLYSYQLAGPSR